MPPTRERLEMIDRRLLSRAVLALAVGGSGCNASATPVDTQEHSRDFSSAAVSSVIGPRKPAERRPSLSRVGAGYATRLLPDSWAADPLCASYPPAFSALRWAFVTAVAMTSRRA